MRLGILIAWSGPEGADTGVQATLLWIYPVLLSALISVDHWALRIDDIECALPLVLSPLTMYLVFVSRRDSRGKNWPLQEDEIASSYFPHFPTLTPFLWLGLAMAVALSSRTSTNRDRGHEGFFPWTTDFSYGILESFTSFN